MVTGWLTLEGSELESLTLTRSQAYPHKMRLKIQVKCKGAILSFQHHNFQEHTSEDQTTEYSGGFYILQSKGYLELSGSSVKLTINASIPKVWHSDPERVVVVSEPLSPSDIHEMDEEIGSGEVKVYWRIDAWGFLEESAAAKCKLPSTTLIKIDVSPRRRFTINRQNFVKNVLEPADMLRRMFIEVIIEPIDDLKGIKDAEAQRILKILFDKQKILIEAYTKFINAKNSADYRSVINDVRLVLEALKAEEMRNVVKKAFEVLGIARETSPGALTKVADEVTSVILEQTKKTYTFACKLAPHAKTGKHHYIPKPSKREAEFALLHVLTTLNYLIKVLKVYALRL